MSRNEKFTTTTLQAAMVEKDKRLPVLVPNLDGKTFYLFTAFYYEKWNGKLLKIPQNFITDFASVPKVFRSVVSRLGKHTIPAIIHDFLYYEQSVSRLRADKIFLQAMRDYCVNVFTRYLLFVAVRLFGMGAWWRWTRRKV